MTVAACWRPSSGGHVVMRQARRMCNKSRKSMGFVRQRSFWRERSALLMSSVPGSLFPGRRNLSSPPKWFTSPYSTWRPRHRASEIRLRTRSRCGSAKRRRTQTTLTGNFTAWLLQQVERLISSLLGSGWTLRTSRLWNIKWNGYSVWGGFLGANKNIANSVKRTNLSASSVKLTLSFYFNSLVARTVFYCSHCNF